MKTILILDDRVGVHEFGREILDGLDVAVTSVHTVDEMTTALDSIHYDLISLDGDLGMTGGGKAAGLRAAREVVSRFTYPAKSPVVVLHSGHSSCIARQDNLFRTSRITPIACGKSRWSTELRAAVESL